jgi:hypothetical protein
MADRHPAGLPELFLDRSLGRRQVPALLRAAGLQLRTLSEEYGIPADELVADTEWLELAGRNGWIALMKDERIRYRPVERAALLTHGVRAFCLTSGNMRAAAMAATYVSALPAIVRACSEPGPFLFAVSPTGLRQVDLSN